MEKKLSFRRVLLKLSGETFMGSQSFGIDPLSVAQIADYLKRMHLSGLQLGIVMGGGNICRGVNLRGPSFAQTPADHIGMLATLLNGVALQEALKQQNVPVRLMSALDCPKIVESYNWNMAERYLKEGMVVIFVGGTGNPYFTTDTAAALRAAEIGADLLLKATKVDGIYNKDPLKHSEAIKYQTISYSEILAEKLQVMDATAIALCRQNKMPIYVFNMSRLINENIEELLTQPEKGTWVLG